MHRFKYLITGLIISISIATSAIAQTTVTLQQGLNGYAGAADNWIIWSSGADLNKGGEDLVDMRADSDYGLFRFAILQSEGGPVPSGATINSATLSLYKSYGPDAVFKASRLLKNWTEMGSTWNSTGTGTAWSTPGAQGAGTDVVATADGQGSAPDSLANNCADGVGHDICWLNIDVTSGVRAFASGASQNFGWLLQQVSSSDVFRYKDFNAKDSVPFPQYRPKLTVTYTVAAPPPPPPPPPSSSTNVTLQQGLNGYTGAADNWIIWSSGADLNKGGEDLVDMRADSDYGLFRFAIFQSEGGPVPNGATINSATLSLYKSYGVDAVFKASRLLKNWTELGSTWNSTGTGAAWSTPGAQGAGTDVLATADGQGSAPDSLANNCADGVGHEICWLNINVTSGVQAFASGAAQNFGWLLQQVSSSDVFAYKDFNAKDSVPFPQYRPKLTINYTSAAPTCTAPTASFTANPGSGAAPLAVTFDASGSTDGSSPINGLTLQFGDGQQVSWAAKTQTQAHTYGSPGSYTATLTASNSCGTSAPVTRTVTATDGRPTAQLTASPASGQAPLTVQFSASTSTDGASPISSLTLTFGDGQQVTWADKNAPQPHSYANAGTYTASLTATNASGTSAPSTQTIMVTAPGGGTVGTGCTNPPSSAAGNGVAIATFHSMSLYYNPPSAPANGQISVRYRKGADDPNTWKQGHPLWYDSRSVHGFHGRGSVVQLQAGTAYVFEVSTDNVNWQYVPGPQAEKCASTWSETFPVGATLTPWTGTKTSTTSSSYLGGHTGSMRNHVLLANQSGTASGYTVYDFTGANAVAQTNNSSNSFPVVISGSYIILKGLKTVGGEDGIWIDPGSHDIVIDNVEVTGYSRDCGAALNAPMSGEQACNEDGGIKFPDSGFGDILSTKRIVIQHSKIHNPAFGSHSWDVAHPDGASPIVMYPTGGQIVIRYNAVYSTTDGTLGGPPDLSHFHQDGLVLGGGNDVCTNCAGDMGIGPDVDIYKNIVMHYFDDGLETDGDGTNNRVWKNYFDYGGASAVSTTPTYVGPVYVWRNVYNRARMFITDPWGNERDRLYMFKSGGLSANGGRRYLYHNTSLQPPYTSENTASGPNSLGAGFGAGGNGGANNMQNTVSRNNVFEMWKSNWDTYSQIDPGNDLDYDLSNGIMSEAHGYGSSTPQYQAGNGWSAYSSGRYRLAPGTKGYDDGVVIPNFNDGYMGTAPDRGAHEDGTPDMDFGPSASGN
jgi:PKD repeat protein